MRKRISILLVCACLLLAANAGAQTATGRITGTVYDSSGAVVTDAKVTAVHEATGISHETRTSSTGSYAFPLLPPGSYTIIVTYEGFQTFRSVKNTLTIGDAVVINATLTVGATTETVQVESSYERLETANAMLSGVVSRDQIVELPLNGRNPLNLIVFEPGLIQRSTGAAGSGTHVFGSRDRAHNVTIDGIDANESSVPNPQSNVYRLTPDNVQEYRVVTHNATPEFGRNSGANVAVATRQGTNEFHGDLFYFHRNTVLNSNEWFNNAQGLERPILLLHQFGGDIGGPIIKNRTFFFFSYQGNRIKQTQPISQSFGIPIVYTQAAKNGAFRYVKGTINVGGVNITQNDSRLVDASGNLRPGVPVCANSATDTNCVATYGLVASDPAALGFDTNMKAMIDSFPLPNTFDVGDGLNTGGFAWNPPSKFTGPFFQLRGDHKFNDNHNIFARMLWSDYDTIGGDFLNSRPRLFPGFNPLGEVFRSSQNLAVSYRAVLSPRMVNEFTMGFSRFNFFFSLNESNQVSGILAAIGQECFGNDSTDNIDTPYCNTPHTQRAVSTIQFIDNFSFSQSAHVWKAGFNFRFYRHNDSRGVPGGVNLSPTILFRSGTRDPTSSATAPAPCPAPCTFSAAPGISSSDAGRHRQWITELAGIPAQVNQVFQANLTDDVYTTDLFTLGTRLKHFDVYLQDEWKIKRNLTITYGVRWEWKKPSSDCCDRTFVPDGDVLGSGGPISYKASDSWWGRENRNTLAPRLALAWDPWSNGRTVVRAGWGMAYDTISTFQVTAIGGMVPGSVKQCFTRVPFGTPAAPPSGCADLRTTNGGSVPTNARLTQLLAALGGTNISLPLPPSTPSSGFSPPAAVAGTAPGTGAFDPNLKVPTVHEWSLTIQRELPAKFAVEFGYIGKRGMRLYRAYDANQIFTDQPGLLADFQTALTNISICRANSTACLAAQQAAGVSTANRTADNFANWGLAGQGNMPLLSNLFGNTAGTGPATNTAAVFRGTNATNVLNFSLGGLASRIDQAAGQTPITLRGFPANFFRPNPQFTSIFYFDSGGGSSYHGLIINLRRRFERGLTLGAAYTLSKSIDDMSVDPVAASSGGGLSTTNSRTPTDVRNFALDRSVSDFDNRHVFTMNALWEVPYGKGQRWGNTLPTWANHVLGGWTVTSIYTYQSGEPYTLNSGQLTVHNTKNSNIEVRGAFLDSNLADVANVTGPVLFNVGPRITNTADPNYNCRQVLDPLGGVTTTYFCIPPAGSFGNVGRNAAPGPSFWNVDLGILKNFQVTERIRMQFRTEMFNAFNHANFANPRNASVGSATLTSSQFGRTCCVADAIASSTTVIANGEPNRVIQFALKIGF